MKPDFRRVMRAPGRHVSVEEYVRKGKPKRQKKYARLSDKHDLLGNAHILVFEFGLWRRTPLRSPGIIRHGCKTPVVVVDQHSRRHASIGFCQRRGSKPSRRRTSAAYAFFPYVNLARRHVT